MVEGTCLFRNLRMAERNGFLHYYFFNSREVAWLFYSAIFGNRKKKPHETCSQADYYSDQPSILSLITSNAFCHLLVTNLHLANYQRNPNQWVIGVEDCVDNPGNEITEKLTAGEESLHVTSVKSYTQHFSTILT